MSDQTNVEEPEWPTHCPLCGTELESAVVDSVMSDPEQQSRGEMANIIAVDFCPNPDCPGKESDLAKATGPDGAQS